MKPHHVERECFTWTSIGKFGKGPIRTTVLKDISDEHLMKIIDFIPRNPRAYKSLTIMENEVLYRVENDVHVDEYYGQDDPQEDPADQPFEDDDEENLVDLFR
jgi:hypothetical protein